MLLSLFASVLMTSTLPLKVDPLKKIRPVVPVKFALTNVPLNVVLNVVLSLSEPVPPLIVPVVKVFAPVVVKSKLLKSTMPVYPLMVRPAIVTGTSMVQFPFRAALKVTTSVAPGTEKPPAPPETFDQLAGLFQLEAEDPTQNRWAKLV